MRCKICFDSLDTEHLASIWGLNPITFRLAWMHYSCCQAVYFELSYIKKDKYDQHESR